MSSNLVHCATCQNFIRNPTSSPQAFGKCKPFEEFKLRNPSAVQLDIVERRLGNHPKSGPLQFYPGFEPYRVCEKYLAR